MKATIKTYKTNADVFFGEIKNLSLNWDGICFDNKDEWNDWADYALQPIREAENYEDVRMSLYTATYHLIDE